MGTFDFNRAIHIKYQKTSKETITDANGDAQCEWIFNSLLKVNIVGVGLEGNSVIRRYTVDVK